MDTAVDGNLATMRELFILNEGRQGTMYEGDLQPVSALGGHFWDVPEDYYRGQLDSIIGRTEDSDTEIILRVLSFLLERTKEISQVSKDQHEYANRVHEAVTQLDERIRALEGERRRASPEPQSQRNPPARQAPTDR